MENLKLKNSEVVNLYLELNDILSKEISFVAKFKISKLFNKVVEVIKPYEDIRKELFVKYEIANKTQEELNKQDLTEFNLEIQKILDEQVEITYEPISIDTFSEIKTDKLHPVLFKFIV